jgi:hypothetical protein
MTGWQVIVYLSVAIVILTIANLSLSVIRWFGTFPFIISLGIFAHSIRLVQVMARTALVYRTVTIVVFAGVTDLGIVIIRRFGAIAI